MLNRTHGAYIILECSIFSHSSNPFLSTVYIQTDLLHNNTYLYIDNNNSSGCINKTYHFVPFNAHTQKTAFLDCWLLVKYSFVRSHEFSHSFLQMIHIFRFWEL